MCAETPRGSSVLLFVFCNFFPFCKVYIIQNGQCPGKYAAKSLLLHGCRAACGSRDLASCTAMIVKKKKKKRCVISLHKLYINSLPVDRLPSNKINTRQGHHQPYQDFCAE